MAIPATVWPMATMLRRVRPVRSRPVPVPTGAGTATRGAADDGRTGTTGTDTSEEAAETVTTGHGTSTAATGGPAAC